MLGDESRYVTVLIASMARGCGCSSCMPAASSQRWLSAHSVARRSAGRIPARTVAAACDIILYTFDKQRARRHCTRFMHWRSRALLAISLSHTDAPYRSAVKVGHDASQSGSQLLEVSQRPSMVRSRYFIWSLTCTSVVLTWIVAGGSGPRLLS